jgi:hypothetical protein
LAHLSAAASTKIGLAHELTSIPCRAAASRIRQPKSNAFRNCFSICAVGFRNRRALRGKAGRNPVLLSDAVFAATFKVYSTVSTRRFSCDLKDTCERGYVTKLIHYNSICAYLENQALTPIYHGLIARSARPLASVEADFAVDSSEFSSSKFDRWFDEKYGCERSKHRWVKMHLCCGVKTNIVTAVRILDKDANDCPRLLPIPASRISQPLPQAFKCRIDVLSHQAGAGR